MEGRRLLAICGIAAALAAVLALAAAGCSPGNSGTVTLSQETVQGALRSLEGNQLTIRLDDGSTVTIAVTDEQAAQSRPLVARQVKVKVHESGAGKGKEADDIELRGEEVEFSGRVQSVSATSWTVGGKTFTVNANTELEESIGVGTMARVEYLTLSDGTLMATEIEEAEAEETTPAPSPTGTPSASVAGAQLYASWCATCHGADRQGRVGPPLTPGRLAGESDAELAGVISSGEDVMPGFSGQLTAGQISAIVQFLRSPS